MHQFKDILFSKYQNPLVLLSTMNLSEAVDFYFYVFDEKEENKIYEQWLHAFSEMTWSDYRKKFYHSIREQIKRQMIPKQSAAEMVSERLAKSSNVIKFKRKEA